MVELMNLNGAVDELVEARLLNRLLAQTEITFFQLNDRIVVESPEAPMALPQPTRFGKDHRDMVGFYVKEHNCRLPHSALWGQTRDEMYFGKGGDIPGKLEASRKNARKERIETDRTRSCRACETPIAIAS